MEELRRLAGLAMRTLPTMRLLLRKRWFILLAGLVGVPLVAASALCLVPNPVTDAINRTLDRHYSEMYVRARKGEATARDRLELRVAYAGMVAFGRVAYPEAAAILEHYLAGRTGDLNLSPVYFRQSPVIRKALAQQRCGRIGPVSFRVRDDPRVAYAVNGFFLDVRCEGERRHIDLNQRIEFASLRGRARPVTPLRIGQLQVRLDDALIHVFDDEGACKPFTVHAGWTE